MKTYLFDQAHAWREDVYRDWLKGLSHSMQRQHGLTLNHAKALAASSHEFECAVATLLELVLHPSTSQPKEYAQMLLYALRRALREAKYRERRSSEDEAVLWLHRVATRYFDVPLHATCTQLVKEVMGQGKKIKLTPDFARLEEILLGVQENIDAAPDYFKGSPLWREFRRVRDALAIQYDPYAQTNVPYLLFTTEIEGREVRNIRMGTPTVGGGPFAGAVINAEFRAWMQAYANAGKRHLYINVQNRDPTTYSRWSGMENDARRCRALEDLPKEFPNTLLVVSMSKNSLFYHQRGPYAERGFQQWPRFRAEFLAQLLTKKEGGFFFPENAFPREELKAKMEQLLDEVHADFFHQNKLLARRERQNFVELFYARLQDWLVKASRVDSYNITCKDGIDRGAGSNVLLYLYQHIQAGGKTDHETFVTILTMLFAPALIVRRRSIRRKRIQRLSAAAQCFLQHIDVQQQILQRHQKEQQRITRCSIPQQEKHPGER